MNNTEELVISTNRKLFDLQLGEILKYRTLIFMLVKRDFVTYYKQTILGPVWYLISPVLSTAIYMIVFGKLAGMGTDNIPQPLFYFSGTMLWTLFSDDLIKVSKVFSDNKDLFGKVYFPRIAVPIANVCSNMIKFSIQMLLFICICIYYMMSGSIRFTGIMALWFILSVIWIVIIAGGLGMIISSITTKYRDIAMALEFIISLLMYATPVVYPVSELSGKFKTVICLNPMSAPLEIFRYAFFGISSIPVWSVIYSILVSLVILFFGIVVFNHNEKEFIDVI